MGASPSGDRAVAASPFPAVSPVPASIPSAATIYWALCLAAKTRQDALIESWHTADRARNNPDYHSETRRDAGIASAVFIGLAKAARCEAEALKSAAQAIEARRAEPQGGSVHESAARKGAPDPSSPDPSSVTIGVAR